MEQLLLVTSCDSPAGIGASLRTDAQCTRDGWTTDGWTDRRDVGNSILDDVQEKKFCKYDFSSHTHEMFAHTRVHFNSIIRSIHLTMF